MKSPEVEDLAVKIQNSCIAFARTDDPSRDSTGTWPVYRESRIAMIFDIDTRIETAPFEVGRKAWDRYDLLFTTPI